MFVSLLKREINTKSTHYSGNVHITVYYSINVFTDSTPSGTIREVIITWKLLFVCLQLPYLSVTSAKDRNRFRRSTSTDLNGGARVCSENGVRDYCCRYPLDINFDEIGWHWIINPRKFRTNYCFGECPLAFAVAYTGTFVTGMAATDTSAPKYIGPCCNPVAATGMTMMYYNTEMDTIYIDKISGLVAEICGCAWAEFSSLS